MILKEKLLSIGYVIDNEYLDKYCRLVEDNISTPKIKHENFTHHIIPQSYFKYNKLEIDNSAENLVNLSLKDHIFAHYYLSLCGSTPYYKKSNGNSVKHSISHIYSKNVFNIKEQELEDVVKELIDDMAKKEVYKYVPMSQVQKELRSKLSKGRVWIKKGTNSKFVFPNELDEYLSNGWEKGRYITEETMEKYRKAKLGIPPKNKGIPYTPEQKEKLLIAMSKRKLTPTYKKVSQYTMDGEFIATFNSIKEASIQTKTHASKISSVCHGHRKSANKSIWKLV